MTRKKFTTMLDADILQQIKIQAVREHTDVSRILERLIREYLAALEHSNVHHD